MVFGLRQAMQLRGIEVVAAANPVGEAGPVRVQAAGHRHDGPLLAVLAQAKLGRHRHERTLSLAQAHGRAPHEVGEVGDARLLRGQRGARRHPECVRSRQLGERRLKERSRTLPGPVRRRQERARPRHEAEAAEAARRLRSGLRLRPQGRRLRVPEPVQEEAHRHLQLAHLLHLKPPGALGRVSAYVLRRS